MIITIVLTIMIYVYSRIVMSQNLTISHPKDALKSNVPYRLQYDSCNFVLVTVLLEYIDFLEINFIISSQTVPIILPLCSVPEEVGHVHMDTAYF